MDRPCDICGGYTDQGIAVEAIITCSKCRLAREHLYCMRDNLSYQNWDKWVCESCTKEDGMLSSKPSTKGDLLPSSANIAHYDVRHLASPSKRHNSSGWQAHSSRQKAVTSGKVRFITNEEVQQLYRTKSTSPIKSSAVFKTSVPKSPLSRVNAPSDVTQPKRGRPPKKQNISISEKGSAFSIARSVAPPRRGRPPKMLSISKINQQASQIREHSQEKRSPGTHTKGHSIEVQPKIASVLSQGAETSSRKIVKEQNKLSCAPSSSRDSSLNMSSGGEASAAEHKLSDDEERDLLNIFSSLHLYRSYLPALHATWKGGFVIYDADKPAQFIGGLQAQLPSKVHRKVFDFSQKMPSVLKATLLPRLHLWDDPFHNECPALEDVALYLFPDDNIASSRETYASLFEVMHTTNSVMRIYFDGVDAVELLIYTSKQLRLYLLDTVTCPKTQNFLWGIFRPKSDGQADMDDSATTADMEVDMVGGKMVGSIDVVVPKDQQPIMTSKDMEVDMVGGKMVGSIDVVVPKDQQPIMTSKDMEVDMVGGKMVGSIDVVVPKDQQPIMTSKDMEVDMVGGKMVGSVDVVALKDSSTTSKMSQQPIMALKDTSTPSPSRMSLQPIMQQPTMTPVQQLLRITKAEYSDYLDKVRALDTAIKQILGVKSEELKDSDTSASSAMTTTPALQQVKLEKEEDEMVGTSSTINYGHSQS